MRYCPGIQCPLVWLMFCSQVPENSPCVSFIKLGQFLTIKAVRNLQHTLYFTYRHSQIVTRAVLMFMPEGKLCGQDTPFKEA